MAIRKEGEWPAIQPANNAAMQEVSAHQNVKLFSESTFTYACLMLRQDLDGPAYP